MQLNHDAIYLLKKANKEHLLALSEDEQRLIDGYHEYLCLKRFDQVVREFKPKLLSAAADSKEHEQLKSERGEAIRGVWRNKTELAKMLIERGLFTTVSKIHIGNIVDAYTAMRKPIAKQFFQNNLTYIEPVVRPAQAFDILKLDGYHFICLDAGFFCCEQNKFVSANVIDSRD